MALCASQFLVFREQTRAASRIPYVSQRVLAIGVQAGIAGRDPGCRSLREKQTVVRLQRQQRGTSQKVFGEGVQSVIKSEKVDQPRSSKRPRRRAAGGRSSRRRVPAFRRPNGRVTRSSASST